jgi:hypothetical protein
MKRRKHQSFAEQELIYARLDGIHLAENFNPIFFRFMLEDFSNLEKTNAFLGGVREGKQRNETE